MLEGAPLKPAKFESVLTETSKNKALQSREIEQTLYDGGQVTNTKTASWT